MRTDPNRPRATRPRLHVDWTRCDGHGSCVELLDDLLTEDPWGFPLPRSGESQVQLPDAAMGRARRAVATCPLQALRVVAD